MNEKFEQFRKELESKTPEELEQGYNNFIKAIHNLPIDYDESMKELAKVRGKDENHYLDNEEKKPFFKGYKPPYYFRNATEEENEAYSKGLKEISKPTGIKLFEEQKNLYIVNYEYKEISEEKYQRDTILIKALDNKDVHKYMDRFRQTFMNSGYDMKYSFQKVGDSNFVEV